MLHELRIENMLLIERAELRFDAGLNAITGETGAGKTILAHSLDLLMGGKARPQIVRPGAGEAYVEGGSASAADLRAVGSRLLAFYGQHEHRRLVLAAAQLDILDGFAGPEHLERRARYRAAHADASAISGELDDLREREGARERNLDLFRYELAEIEAAAPDPAE